MLGEKNAPATFDMPGSIAALRQGLIGSNLHVEGPFGRKRVVYADYTASGRALVQVEDWIKDNALPFYANAHTEVSACGERMNWLRTQARAQIAASVGAGAHCDVIFCGSGATAAVNRLPNLFGLNAQDGSEEQGDPKQPVVLTGPYEHHSNILPWREAGAKIIEIDEALDGGVDLYDLESALQAHSHHQLVIGSFTVASNATGILTDVTAVTRILKSHGALAVWDYACGAPYLQMRMDPSWDAPIDALFFSPHKFPGGPGASGVLVIRKDAVQSTRPTHPGGGAVLYVSQWAHDYHEDVVVREEAGTPNILGDLRAALAVSVRDGVGAEEIESRGQRSLQRALCEWKDCVGVELLGNLSAKRLPIISFLIRDSGGNVVHHRFVTRLLSDLFGIQAREGCSCAGPYGHRLLDVDRPHSERIRTQIHQGQILAKPGWTRLNFCHLMDEHTVEYIIEAVSRLPQAVDQYAQDYVADPRTGNFRHCSLANSAETQTNAFIKQEAV